MAEGRTQTSTERDAKLSQGYLSKIIYGDRGRSSVDPEKIRALADLLHVNFEWLFIGRGPMRRGGRDATPAEEAIVFCRHANTREDAIRIAWERNKDQVDSMTAPDWVLAIDAEARKLDRARVPRPEEVAAQQEALRKTSAKMARQKALEASRRAAEALDAEVFAFLHPARAGGSGGARA